MTLTINELKKLILEAVQEVLEEKKELKGKQKKLDVDHDGELTGHDFKILSHRSKGKAAKAKKDKE